MTVEDLFRRSFPHADQRWNAFGVDVSGWQEPSALSNVAGLDCGMAVVKLSEGPSYRSAEAVMQCSDAHRSGMAHGVYHYVTFMGVQLEAANLLAALAGVDRPTMQDRGFAAGVWLDAEDTFVGRHGAVTGYGAYLEELALAVEASSGIPVGIYTAAWWSDGRIEPGDPVTARPLWAADYDDGTEWLHYTDPKIPNGWTSAVGWQFTSHTEEWGGLDLNAFAQTLVLNPAPVQAAPPAHDVWLSVGVDAGEDVSAVQAQLIAWGYDPGPVDGIYGPLTEAAVVSFQLDRVLVADGIVGPITFAYLNATS